MELAGKKALVTGGGGGIGAGIAEALVERGARVIVTDLKLEYAQAEAARIGRGTLALQHDVSSLDSWAAVRAEAERAFGEIDVLVNNAGISTRRMLLDEMPPETFAQVFAVNVTGVYNGVRTFVPAMRARRRGHVVNVSSMNGLLAHQTYATYSGSKFAVTALSEALRGELAAFDIGVSVLFPGLTRSRMSTDPETGAATDIPDPQLLESLMMEPIWLGRAVAKAIETNELYVISHPGYKDAVAARYQNVLDAFREPAQPDYRPLPMRR